MAQPRKTIFSTSGAAIIGTATNKQSPLEKIIKLKQLKVSALWINPQKTETPAFISIIQELKKIQPEFPSEKTMKIFYELSQDDLKVETLLQLIYNDIDTLIKKEKSEFIHNNPNAEIKLKIAENNFLALRNKIIREKDIINNRAKTSLQYQRFHAVHLSAALKKIKSEVASIFLQEHKTYSIIKS